MSGFEENALPFNQQTAAELLASGLSVTDTAKRVYVTPDTVTRWKRNPVFIQEVRRLQAERFADCSARVQKMVEKALDILEENHEETMYERDIRISLAILRFVGAKRLFGAGSAKP